MGEKMEIARLFRIEMDDKYRGKSLTLADLEQMDKDNEIYKKLAKEAREEWLAEIAAKGEKGE